MRLLVSNSNTTQEMTEAIGAAARAVAAPETELTWASPDAGPRSIEGFTDEALAAASTVELVARTRDDYVIACFGDPGLAAYREVADVPVLGIPGRFNPWGTFVAVCSSSSTEGRWCSRSRCPRRRGESKPSSARGLRHVSRRGSHADR
jgi:hypothetical protein